jgi:hypothetical protein
MVFNVILNNMSVLSLGEGVVLLVEETGVPGEDHRLVSNQ